VILTHFFKELAIMVARLESEEKSDEAPSTFRKLEARYPSLFRTAKFATGSAIGFLDTVIILTIGTYGLYGSISAPSYAFNSPYFIMLNVFAFVVGVTVAFFINESLIFKSRGYEFDLGLGSLLLRLGKFQLVFLIGNLITIGVELFLLKMFAIPPVYGIIAGALISFPITYFFSMHFIWQLGIRSRPKTKNSIKYQEEISQLHFHQNPVARLPERIVTQDRIYNLTVLENRFDIFPAAGKREETRVEFALRVDVSPEN